MAVTTKRGLRAKEITAAAEQILEQEAHNRYTGSPKVPSEGEHLWSTEFSL